ncbi:MAG: TonB-dependent receptor [Alphaproteobacteria bacterium]|nr:TonB-dependent receptor [Alphaproteobacteria bacterium]MBV9695019.1 TonB-dependent receptor [Alphaproteobacteria bacterium]
MTHRNRAVHLAGTVALGFLALFPVAASASDQVETVVVTAERRPENILKVGINVMALSAEQLRVDRVETAMDLAAHVPNVDVKTNIPGAQQIITIRGVGLDDFSSTNNSSVGVYVDDVFLSSFAEMDFNFYDLDRIEVLKGPQGTLYGRNSTAGAINVISAKPSTDAFAAQIEAGYGNFDTFDAEGYVNMPLSDDLAVRISGRTIQQGTGYWFSRVLNRDLGRQDIDLGRGQALWAPKEGLKILLKVDGEHNDSEIGVGKFFGTISTNSQPCPDFSDPSHCINAHGYTDTTRNPFQGDWNHAAPYKVDRLNTTLRVDDDFGWAQLTSVTGFIDFKRSFYTDVDAAPTTDAEFDQNDKVQQFSQELRLAGSTTRWDWLAGGYYSWDRVKTFTPGYLTDLFNTQVLITSDQRTTSGAAFGQVKYHLTDAVTLTGGLRFTDEERRYVGGTTDENPTGFSILCFITPGCPFGTPGPYALSFENAKIHDDNWSWRGVLNWNPDPDTLVYASVSRGTKSGGFFNGITTVSAALAPYLPEQLTDYEVGVKTSTLEHTLLVDSSVFYYDYKNLQAQTFTNVGAVSLIKLGNIPQATIYGLDLDAQWLPTDGLSLSAALGLLHTRLGAFPFANSSGPVIEPAGNKLPDAPDVSFTGQVRYEHGLWDGYSGAVQMGATYGSSVYFEALNTPYLAGRANWVFDGRASLGPKNGKWELALWGKNLFDEKHVVQATDDGVGMGYRIFNAPRTFGGTFTYKFD